ANASHQLSNNTTGDGSGFTNPWMFARNIAPIYTIHEHDPETGAFVLDQLGTKIFDDGAYSRNQYVGRHVIWENQLNENRKKRNTVNRSEEHTSELQSRDKLVCRLLLEEEHAELR